MPRQTQVLTSSPASESFGDDYGDNIQEIYNASKKKVTDASRAQIKAVMTAAQTELDDIVERYRHAIEETHPVELNAIYKRTIAELGEQDTICAEAWAEIGAANAAGQAAMDALITQQEKAMQGVAKVAKGARATIEKVVTEEHKCAQAIGTLAP